MNGSVGLLGKKPDGPEQILAGEWSTDLRHERQRETGGKLKHFIEAIAIPS